MTRRLASLLATAGVLAACSSAPAPTPPLALPALARPTATAAAPARGNVHVPRGALVERGGAPGVFVLADGQARFRMVRVGKTVGERVEIISGLKGGEALVLGDLAEVHDGSPVKPE